MNINKFAKRAYECALKRGKINGCLYGDALREETISSLREELDEVATSTCKGSEHIHGYSQTIEEIADVLIVCCTELHRRGVNIEDVLLRKMNFNEHRKD